MGQRLIGSRKATPQRCTFYFDDLHLASCPQQKGGAQLTSPVLEMINFAATQESLMDLTRNYQHHLHNVRYIASCTPSGLPRIPSQFHRSFNPVPFIPPSDECLHQIFSKSVLLWLQQFKESAIGDPEHLAEVSLLLSSSRM